MNPQLISPTNNTKRYLQAFVIVVVLIVVYQFIHALATKNSTGILEVDTNISNTTITVTKNNSLEKVIGTDSAKVRIQPGSYAVVASVDSKQASQEVSIQKGKTTLVSLTPVAQKAMSTTSSVPSIATQAEDNAIVHYLPFTGAALSYQITYKFTGPNKTQLVLIVTAPTSAGQQLATTWLQGLGFNPSSLNIQYYYGDIAD